MKKKIFSVATVCFVVLAVILGNKFKTAYDKRQSLGNDIGIPKFIFYNSEGREYSNDSLIAGRNRLFVYFNTTCEHCQNEAGELRKNCAQLPNSMIYFISTEPISVIKKFKEEYFPGTFSNIVFLKDSSNNYFKTFESMITPTVNVYNENGKLLKIIKGEAKIELLVNVLKNETEK